MSDVLERFLEETAARGFSMRGGGCGGWAVRWAVRRTGRRVRLPDVRTLAQAAEVDLPAMAADYALLFGFIRKDKPARGDVGLFDAADGFRRINRHALGICCGDGFWAFKMRHGWKFRRGSPIEAWG